jgi:hypothetical protein
MVPEEMNSAHEVIKPQDLHKLQWDFSTLTVSAKTLKDITNTLLYKDFDMSVTSAHMVIIADHLAALTMHDLNVIQEALKDKLFPEDYISETVIKTLHWNEASYTCLNLQNGKMLMQEKNGEQGIVIMCRMEIENDGRLERMESNATNTSSPVASLGSLEEHLFDTKMWMVEDVSDIIKFVMGADSVSMDIDMSFLKQVNSMTDRKSMQDWACIKASLPYCKHSYMQLFQVRKLLSTLAHLCTSTFHAEDDVNVLTGLVYTHHMIFDKQRLFASDSIENKLRYLMFRGSEQPNTVANMRMQLQKYWPEAEVEILLQEVIDEAKIDFFSVITASLIPTLWVEMQWNLSDIERIGTRMNMSITGLCSSNSFMSIQATNISAFTVLPLFIGVDMKGNLIEHGRKGVDHYKVNELYMALIEKSVALHV